MKAISLLLIFVSCASFHPKAKENLSQPEKLREVLLTAVPKFRDCYLKSETYKENKNSNEHQSLTLLFTITPEGNVARNSKIVNSDLDDPAFNDCLKKELSQLNFGPQKGNVEVKHLVNLYPRTMK